LKKNQNIRNMTIINEKQEDNELEIVDLNNGKYEVKMKLKGKSEYSKNSKFIPFLYIFVLFFFFDSFFISLNNLNLIN